MRAIFPAILLAIGAALLLAGCGGDAPSRQMARVNAADHQAFWLWAGVKPQPVLAQAKTLYVLEAELQAAAPDRWQSRLAATPKPDRAINPPMLWIVYRVETLRWSPVLYDRLIADVARWRAAGNQVQGVQIDFDSQTRHLDQYAGFLRDVRRRLPSDVQLGITGLLDWGAHADPDALNALGDVVDDFVLQTYQGRQTIANYQAYLDQLHRLRVPFRIGLVQDGAWDAPLSLAQNPYFRGYVVFLVNPRS
jgi:hypothetical protein